MCGICGVVQLRGEPRPVVAPEVLDRMTDAMTHRGPNDRGTYLGRRHRARRPPPEHRRRRGRAPAVRERGRQHLGRSRTASSTTTTTSARACGGAGTASRRAATPRSSRTSTRTSARAFPEQLRGHVRDRALGRPRTPRGDRARPSRDQAALLRRGRRPARLRVGAQERPGQRARRHRPRLRGDRRVPHARLRARPADAARRASASCMPGHRLVVDPSGVRARARTGSTRSPRRSR